MDFKPLLEKLKTHGLDIAEDAAKVLMIEVLDFAEKMVIDSENKYDDMLLAVMPMVKSEMLKAIDKIDGQEG